MAVNVTLNDDCLLQIFGHLSLAEQLQLRAVCSRWHLLLDCFIFRRRRSLHIFGSSDDAAEYERAILRRYSVSRKKKDNSGLLQVTTKRFHQLVEHIPALLPSISELTISYYYSLLEVPPPSVPLHRLLGRWPQLQSLTLSRLPEDGSLQSALWSQLSRLSALRELHLFHVFECTHIPAEPLRTVFGRLTHFTLTGYRGDLVPLLAILGPLLSELRLDYTRLTAEQLHLVRAANASFGGQLRRLTLGNTLTHVHGVENRSNAVSELFNFVSEHFGQISHLQISYPADLPLGFITTSLCRLPHLSHLQVALNLSQLDADHLLPLCPLLKLAHLHLTLFGYPAEHSFTLLSRLAPNLETLTLIFHYRRLPQLTLLQQFGINPGVLPRLRQLIAQRYDQMLSEKSQLVQFDTPMAK